MQPDDVPEFIDLAEVRRMTGGRSKSAIYGDPSFPLPVAFSEPGRIVRRSRWIRREVVEWLQQKIRQRDAQAEVRRQELVAKQARKRAKQTTAA